MTSRPDSATLVPISDLNSSFKGLKVRTAGMLSDYDIETGIANLISGRNSIKINLCLILNDENMMSLVREGFDIFVIGQVECEMDQSLSNLRIDCIQLIECTGLNISLWEQTARRMSQSIHQRVKGRDA